MTATMPRIQKTFRLDARILEGMKAIATASGCKAPSVWLEAHLWNILVSAGYIGRDEQPLGETRGGDRTQSTDSEKTTDAT